jgi:hypothetical protein
MDFGQLGARPDLSADPCGCARLMQAPKREGWVRAQLGNATCRSVRPETGALDHSKGCGRDFAHDFGVYPRQAEEPKVESRREPGTGEPS